MSNQYAVGMLMFTGHFVVGQKIGKSLHKVEHLNKSNRGKLRFLWVHFQHPHGPNYPFVFQCHKLSE